MKLQLYFRILCILSLSALLFFLLQQTGAWPPLPPFSPANYSSTENPVTQAKCYRPDSGVGVRLGGILVNQLFDLERISCLPSYSEEVSGTFPIFPKDTSDKQDDRIWNQMRYVPRQIAKNQTTKEKLFIVYNDNNWLETLKFNGCPVSRCRFLSNRTHPEMADVIIWHHVVTQPNHKRPPGQIWAVSFHESPNNTYYINDLGAQINWTISYRPDSTVTYPYCKYTPYNLADYESWRRWSSSSRNRFVRPPFLPKPTWNYAQGKTKKVAWFTSNCRAHNRLRYAGELAKYIQVDIYGKCGNLSCLKGTEDKCFDMLRKDYKFYLAFENSNCRGYISEKFIKNGLRNHVIPVVMGAHPDDYDSAAAPHSFIHVDDFDSPKDLAEYLHFLDAHDEEYSSYFAWHGTGIVSMYTYLQCRLCMMAFEMDNMEYHVPNYYEWWRKENACVEGRWIPKPGRRLWLSSATT